MSNPSEAPPSYTSRPSFDKKFRSSAVGPLIREILEAKLKNSVYDPENTPKLTKEIADEIKKALKSKTKMEQYKFVVQVIIGEQRGEAVKCFWDSDADGLAKETFINESLFCVATAYGIYYY